MNNVIRLITSSIGKKILMGLTGLGLFGFVIIHMLGNLQIFIPSTPAGEALNAYAKLLKASPEILWGFRLGLLGMAVVHVICAVQLTIENRAARKTDYAKKQSLGATLASRSMALSGMIVLSFIVFHILHFTVMSVFDYSSTLNAWEGHHDVYAMVVHGFSIPWVSGFYVLAVGLLCLHLSHGVSSLFHSLGLINPGYAPWIHAFSKGISLVLFLGFSAVPLSVLFGLIK